jgi:hypothetical protein
VIAAVRDRLGRTGVWRDALAPVIGLRIVVLLFGALAVILFRPDAAAGVSILDLWNRWDGPHFFELARGGYGYPTDPARIVLLPLFPALIAALSVVLDPLIAAMTIAFAATAAAAGGLYLLARLDADRMTGRVAVLAMALFPTAFTLVAPYSEAPFLAFAVWSFLCARRDNWRAAGLFALLAGATRIQGLFIGPALLVEYLHQRRRLDREAGWILLAAGGPLIYLGINAFTFGDPLYFLEVQRDVFHVETIAPWLGLGHALDGVLAFRPEEFWVTVYLAPFLALVGLAVTVAWTLAARGGRPSYAVYAALSLVSFASLSWPISVPRYLMGVFPVFLAIGWTASRPWLATVLLVGSGLVFALFTTLFVIGHWAF